MFYTTLNDADRKECTMTLVKKIAMTTLLIVSATAGIMIMNLSLNKTEDLWSN